MNPSVQELLLAVDGLAQPMNRGDVLKVSRRDKNVRFIHLPGHSYFAVLRQKLHWSTRPSGSV